MKLSKLKSKTKIQAPYRHSRVNSASLNRNSSHRPAVKSISALEIIPFPQPSPLKFSQLGSQSMDGYDFAFVSLIFLHNRLIHSPLPSQKTDYCSRAYEGYLHIKVCVREESTKLFVFFLFFERPRPTSLA